MTAGRTSSPAVVIHGLDDARAALDAAARAGCDALTLLSAPDAACFMGAAWWRALLAAASAFAPGLRRNDLLDCGDAAGRAVEALRLGQRGLVLSATCPQRLAVLERAAPLGAVVLARRPPALDLAEPGAARRLQAWLSGARTGATDDSAGRVG